MIESFKTLSKVFLESHWCGYTQVLILGSTPDDSDKIPPHELVDRKLARSQISSSVSEGAGRTIKGREVTKVRNAVMTSTGFLKNKDGSKPSKLS